MRKLKPCIKLAAKELQFLVRIEEATIDKHVLCIKPGYNGYVVNQFSSFGYCRCITCGVHLPYSSSAADGNQMQGGHFLCGRTKAKSIMIREDNVHPQCSGCNKGLNNVDVQSNYRSYMVAKYGLRRVEELEQQKRTGLAPTKDQILQFRQDTRKRIAKAKEVLKCL